MKHYRWLMALVVGALFLAACGGMQAAVPDDSVALATLDDPTYYEEWDGRGSDSERCGLLEEGDPRLDVEGDGWIHWVFATKGDSEDARLTVNGVEYEPGEPLNANIWHFYTPYADINDENFEAFIELFGGDPGPGGGLVISDYCPGDQPTESNVVLSGTKSIDGIVPPDDALAGYEIEVFFVNLLVVPPLFEQAATDPDPIVTNDFGQWTATLGPFADGTELDLAVCEVPLDGWEQVSPAEGDVDTIVNPDDGRVCHLVSVVAGEDATVLGLDFTNANEELTVEKTVVTSFTRTHEWDIDKRVETENDHVLDDGTPKIWLYTDGSGDETATWTVDVTYEGYVDGAFNVSGTITIENTGRLDAVITDVVDTLAGNVIDVECDEELPFTLAVGETLLCTYDEDGYVEGFNEAKAVTERDEYEAVPVEIEWGEPDEELYATVNIKDISDLFGEVDLGTVTAPNDATFDYEEHFAYEDFGQALCGSHRFDNTASIVETGQYDDAVLKVNVQCYDFESAWAMGVGDDVEAKAFCDNGFSNWGWTNEITRTYDGSWPLYAGAAQCDPSKGTLVGYFEVDHNGGGFSYKFIPLAGEDLLFEGEAVYADAGMFPMPRGRATTAPGQYYVASPLADTIHVIAHVNVGIPDAEFGP
jgi:hypothetical protein